MLQQWQPAKGFVAPQLVVKIYSKVIRQPQFSYISTVSWWERPELETNCIDGRLGYGLLVQDLRGEMT